MASSLYDDLDVLDGTPLGDPTSDNPNSTNAPPLVGLRVTANWPESDPSFGLNPATSSTNSSLKLMQSHMAAKRAQGRRQAADNSGSGQWSSRPSLAPVVDLKQRTASHADGAFRFNQQTGRLEFTPNSTSGPNSSSRISSSPAMTSTGLLFGEPNLSLGISDEYDPLLPNDYEELARLKRERRRAEESALASAHYRSESVSMNDPSGMCKRPDFSDEEDEDVDDFSINRRNLPTTVSKGAAIAPPSSLLEDTNATSALIENTQVSESGEVNSASSKFGINAVAAKMMARMGYREGQGLGRESQGMSTALMVEKTSRRGGKIIHERDQQRQHQQLHQTSSNNNLNNLMNMEDTFNNLPLPEHRSCVILLRNMCGPGEVDDDLEPETAEECAKYGKVIMCMIYELPEAPSEDEMVRIFVEFDSEDAATKAVLDLNGRFFAGRVVKAGFYDADKFRNLELADQPLSA